MNRIITKEKRFMDMYSIKYFLRSEVPKERYASFRRGSLLFTAVSLIAILETHIAKYLGVHSVPYKQIVFITISVILVNSSVIFFAHFKKKILIWHEWALFSFVIIFFQTGFSLWVYRLGELRLLALINALIIIIILISYTNTVQSFILSSITMINYCTVTFYSINFYGQQGLVSKEIFFSFCMLPGFLLVSSSSKYIIKKRKELISAKNNLEKINFSLSEVNKKLKKEQKQTAIEMDLASDIQRAIFPDKLNTITDWDIAFYTKPYGTVSGDFYDFYLKEDELKGLSLFDVSGHGVAPALVTILAKPVLYTGFVRNETSRLGLTIEYANRELKDELEAVNLYITGIILRMKGDVVEYVNAGHPDLIYYNSESHRVKVFQDTENCYKRHPIGICISEQNYPSFEIKVSRGDFLVLYSDGLIESKNLNGEQYGLNALSDAIASSVKDNAESVLNSIIGSLINFTGGRKPSDDITLIVAGKK